MVSLSAWMIGITTTCVIMSLGLIGLFFIYKAIKVKAKLLDIAGLVMFFTGMLYFGPFVDFLLVVFTGKNLNPPYLVGVLAYMWVAPGIILTTYIGAELLVPDKKWYIVGFYIGLGIVFLFFLFFDAQNAFIVTLDTPGEDLIDVNFKRLHPCYIMSVICLLSVLIFLGIGFMIKGIRSQGILRKKSIYLSIGFTTFVVFGAFESSIAPGIGLVIIRSGMVSMALWLYLGLKEESIKVPLKKSEITEEEVSFSKEKKICLVCKGKISGFNIYVCPECEAIYCATCAKAIIDLENMCWACDCTIDESQPIKPYIEDQVYTKKKPINKKSI